MSMLTSRSVPPPAGTFLAKVRNGSILFPPPVNAYCKAEGWDLFRVLFHDHDHFVLEPVIESPNDNSANSDSDDAESLCSSLSADGNLWIPAILRSSVELAEQSVMVRVENGTIGVYLRKVFDTLGFRP